jgi:peptidoglycan/LPS O-acetylase OafA/YrhL
MEEKMDKIKTFMIKKNKRLFGIVLAVVLLLFIPLIAMQFTDEVSWTVLDFVVAAILLLGTGLMCELVIRKINKIKYRIAICVVLLAALLLIWAELAVGIFGTPFSGH